MIKIDSEFKEAGQKILRNIFEKREIVGLMQIVAKRKDAIKKK